MIHRTGRPSVPDLSHVYIEAGQRLLEYADGEWHPVPEERLADAPSIVDILRAHAWDAKKKACACGWNAPVSNHPIHQAHMLTYRSLVWPPAAEYIMDRPR